MSVRTVLPKFGQNLAIRLLLAVSSKLIAGECCETDSH